MNYQEWVEKFKPRKNQFRMSPDFDGTRYETEGEEHYWLLRQANSKIWTIVETLEGLRIIPGYHSSMAIGYFLTEEPWDTSEGVLTFVQLPISTKMITMTYDEWFAKFSPIRNPWKGINDHRFDAAGHQWDYVKARADGWKVWTVVDEEGLHIVPGYHTVNAMGFYITEVRWNTVDSPQMLVVELEPNPYEQELTQEQQLLVGDCHNECPSCTHHDLETGEWDTDGETVYRQVSCNRCNAVWQEVFKFYLNEDMDGKPLLNRSQLWNAK